MDGGKEPGVAATPTPRRAGRAGLGSGTRRRLELMRMLVQVALRNLLASRLKTIIVGGIILFGAVIVVVGSSMLDSIDHSMRQSIVGSLAGDLQVYSSRSKDELSLYGGMMGDTDIAPLEDFAPIKEALLAVPHVRQVVPMGIGEAMAISGNVLDRALERLRDDVRKTVAGDTSAPVRQAQTSHAAHVRRIVELMQADQKMGAEVREDRPEDLLDAASLAKAASPEFWAGFEADPLAALEFLENEIAPQGLDGEMLWIRYTGTDLDAFQQAFDRLQIVSGTPVPRGQRGILLGSLYYEDWCKLKTARRLDRMREEIRINGKTIATDEQLQRWVKENQSQVREITQQLDPVAADKASALLRQALGSKEQDLGRLLELLLATNDANFEQRYRIFYDQLAPLLELYVVRIGDTLTIKAFTKAGYLKSVNVKIYGVYQFKGLEKAQFAGGMSLMDLLTFRDLYGYLTPDRVEEIRVLKASAGAKAISRETAEAELFGGGAAPSPSPSPGPVPEPEKVAPVAPATATAPAAAGAPAATATEPAPDELAELKRSGGIKAVRQDLAQRVYTQAEIDHGVALSVAVLLDSPEHTGATIEAIQRLAEQRGLPLRAVDWQKAAGMIGQFITLARLILYTAVLIIFVIALVIINNAMVMATLQRVKEIGTMRAIGAQRRLILAMLFLETVVIGLLFGGLGAAIGGGIIGALNHVGIPASSDVMYFFFSGPRLHPTLAGANLGVAFVIVLLVSVLSSFYPAFLAMRITPLEAMQSEE